jgi:hypothetical protein
MHASFFDMNTIDIQKLWSINSQSAMNHVFERSGQLKFQRVNLPLMTSPARHFESAGKSNTCPLCVGHY